MLNILLFGAISLIFWGLRIYYWLSNVEQPFSDMADYNAIALKIISDFDFSQNRFWQSYQSPGLPLIRAAQILLMQTDSLIAWQFFLTTLTFLAACWLAYELFRITKRRWLSFLLLLIIALSKSSIFWSYKIATEAISEAFLYLTLASYLVTIRIEKWHWFLITGVIVTSAVLTRPNFVFFLLLVPLFYLLLKKQFNRSVMINLGLYGLAVCLVWTPWLARSYLLYQHLLPFNTHGSITFFWELDRIGKISVRSFQNTAPSIFKNDYEAYQYTNRLIPQWISHHPALYQDLLWRRIRTSIIYREIDLSELPRQTLYGNLLDRFLLDKYPLLIVIGFVGLIMLSLLSLGLLYIFITVLSFWLTSIVMIGYPRLLEPIIPLVLFGNIVILYYTTIIIKHLLFRLLIRRKE